MAKARIGHFYESQACSRRSRSTASTSRRCSPRRTRRTTSTSARSTSPSCAARPTPTPHLGEALRRIAEGAAMIRLKGNAGTGNVMNAVRHARAVFSEIRKLGDAREFRAAPRRRGERAPPCTEVRRSSAPGRTLQPPPRPPPPRAAVERVEQVRANGRLPVVTFAAGGLATPADVAMLMELGVDGVFVGSGIFKGENPATRARAMVAACTPLATARRRSRASRPASARRWSATLENEPARLVDALPLRTAASASTTPASRPDGAAGGGCGGRIPSGSTPLRREGCVKRAPRRGEEGGRGLSRPTPWPSCSPCTSRVQR